MKPADSAGSRPSNRAYTITDLIICLAVLALLGLLQLPTLAGGQSASSSEVCRNNLRRLTQAWLMYAEDHQGRLAPAGASTTAGKHVSNPSWIGGWLDFTSSYVNIETEVLVDQNKYPYGAHLGTYLQKNALLFRCPSDYSTVTIFGRILPRSRSVAVNNWMGGLVWLSQHQFRLHRNLADVSKPAQRWVISDERADSINDAVLLVDMVDNFVDYPGFYHQDGTWMGFVDGHTEFRRWEDSRTLTGFRHNTSIPLNQPSPNNPDLDWLRERTTELR